ncbi:MAG: carboxylesterase family protein [Acidobacteriaceae bacterium]
MHFPCRKLHSITTAAALALFATAAFASNPLKIKTDKGTVEGVYATDGQVRAFKGIPYAAPPVGDLRWAPPQPAAKWFGTLSAKDFGHRCIQSSSYPDMIFHDPGPSEDCLTLNIWTPAHAHRGSLPVMVWIYGGGFVTGGTSEARQDGQYLAHHDVVIVSMNYRLGIFGFFALPGLTAESPHHASGNYGLLDQAAALAWVSRNISNFGGDPHNITLFGESAGSFSVSSQMASPLSIKFLAKAIGESGAAFHSSGLGYPPLAKAELQDAAFAQSAFNTTNLADLRKLSVEQILDAVNAKTTPRPPRFGPDVDGYFLPQSVPDIFAAGLQAHIPLLAGWNADEVRSSIIMNPIKPTVASFTAQAQKDFGDRANDFLAVYPAATDAEATQSAGDFVSDRFIAYSTWAWLEAQVKIVKNGEPPVYRYRFDLGNPGDKFHPAAIGAFHSDDIEYVFGTLDSRQDAHIRPEDIALSAVMQLYWTNFARNGNPNAPNLPVWPTYGPKDGWQVMHLNTTSVAKPDTQRARYLFLDSIWAKPQ